ncbi:glycosyltransferase [bacterium]|nr:glycosyltransferase [bacterium]
MADSLPLLNLVLPLHRWHPDTEQRLQQGLAELRAHLGRTLTLQPILSLDGPVHTPDQVLQNLIDSGWIVMGSTQQRGKGATVRRGLDAEEGDYFVFTDSDFPFLASSVQAVVDRLHSGADVVFGRRSQQYHHQLPSARKRISRALLWFNRTVLKLKHPDTQCGLKGFSPKGLELVRETRSEGFLLDLELALLARDRNDLVWEAVDVETRPGLEFSQMSQATLWKEFREGLGLLTRLGWKSRGTKPR